MDADLFNFMKCRGRKSETVTKRRKIFVRFCRGNRIKFFQKVKVLIIKYAFLRIYTTNPVIMIDYQSVAILMRLPCRFCKFYCKAKFFTLTL